MENSNTNSYNVKPLKEYVTKALKVVGILLTIISTLKSVMELYLQHGHELKKYGIPYSD